MRPLVVALTGGIGSGKSTVCRRLRELGVTVIDADELSREVVRPGQPALAEISRRFGSAVVNGAGELRRAELRRIVFADPAARRDLEGIIHPRIQERVRHAIAACTDPYLVLCVPLLLETDAYSNDIDRIVVVDCAPETQRSRVMARDNLTAAEVDAIMRTQAARALRLQRADDVIENEGEMAEVLPQVDRLHERLLRIARA
ncbi:MAG: dephospho-CoA kinase [Gammaproteobacteria bacterium]|nr:dephospho-CoA kinase [Gammaproteobacteria bacterium]